jgi:predicted small lipoprotein YifL
MRKAARVAVAIAIIVAVTAWLTTCETKVPVYFWPA